ncbi:MAG TPA: imidazoleglycerol-phosphate dehydratase HisB [Termitinemataceae bacterium]|uniref:imidazoleglycerol-phosphate dehydratase HisB n=1 Tax=Treponema sp. J25 TaxID=2094121 RepID=UPI0010528E59|nr:imidazoleglycerol-phosphate dehydratase HisB [Treponema sp. J25]TCW61004.1 imidazoleglycerol-phosphate dehydratase HisB [Treponema sp. J25]HOJ99650.1 imidazoleglycerol-phosphate dehydratase HisB [Termitinemataceae bacterium]HOM24509.1 imidazoleglycerol-phosphate dehydratase HisB [Termitinemataceae bacterium]HPQ01584.1 imidazoleglycerol-phosphate dehydratase HisB [Termitinemataceae bacterium]
MARTAEWNRKTGETDIFISLNLDGEGKAEIDCPIGFMTHMLTTFARHGLFDLTVRARGDLEVDQHHLVEDLGIVLGTVFSRALGDKGGIRRVGSCLYPMDETLARAAVDLCGRPYLVFEGALSGIPLVSGGASFQTDTVTDFWQGFVSTAACALHLDILRGRSDHHKIEALFKAAARALREAVTIDPREQHRIPSTKGVLA